MPVCDFSVTSCPPPLLIALFQILFAATRLRYPVKFYMERENFIFLFLSITNLRAQALSYRRYFDPPFYFPPLFNGLCVSHRRQAPVSPLANFVYRWRRYWPKRADTRCNEQTNTIHRVKAKGFRRCLAKMRAIFLSSSSFAFPKKGSSSRCKTKIWRVLYLKKLKLDAHTNTAAVARVYRNMEFSACAFTPIGNIRIQFGTPTVFFQNDQMATVGEKNRRSRHSTKLTRRGDPEISNLAFRTFKADAKSHFLISFLGGS